MADVIEEKKRLLAQRKQSLQIQEKLLREREKKKRIAQFAEIGNLAYAASIDQFEKTALLGAFLEIAHKLKDNTYRENYSQKGHEFLKKQGSNDSDSIPITITFKEPPGKKVKDDLKEKKFKWNSFRNEYYGHGNRKEIEEVLSGSEFCLDFPELIHIKK